MPTISTKDYLLDQAKRRFTPSITNFPGMGAGREAAAGPRLAAARDGRAACRQ